MAKQLTLTQLKDKRAELENETNEAQAELAQRTYTVELESETNLNAILKQIDKSYEWSIKNAALIVNLHDTLKAAKAENRIAGEGSTAVELGTIDLNTLYTVLTNISGTGVEAARTFTKLLTNIGKQVTDSLNSMADANKVLQAKHTELAELDLAIDQYTTAEVPEADIEITQ